MFFIATLITWTGVFIFFYGLDKHPMLPLSGLGLALTGIWQLFSGSSLIPFLKQIKNRIFTALITREYLQEQEDLRKAEEKIIKFAHLMDTEFATDFVLTEDGDIAPKDPLTQNRYIDKEQQVENTERLFEDFCLLLKKEGLDIHPVILKLVINREKERTLYQQCSEMISHYIREDRLPSLQEVIRIMAKMTRSSRIKASPNHPHYLQNKFLIRWILEHYSDEEIQKSFFLRNVSYRSLAKKFPRLLSNVSKELAVEERIAHMQNLLYEEKSPPCS